MDKLEKEFYEGLDGFAPQIIGTIIDASRKTYVSITNMQTKVVWWSTRAKELFGLESSFSEITKEKTKVKVHPDDKEHYINSFKERIIYGRNLGVPYEYRIQTRKGHYDKFTATSNMIYDDMGQPRFFIVSYENHGVADEVDPITGMWSDVIFSYDLQNYIDDEESAIILKLGLDQFSRMNVLYGADYSDTILYNVAQILMSACSNQGFVYRMPGAKFAIIFRNTTEEQVKNIYNGISDQLANSTIVDGKRIPLKISAGGLCLDDTMKDVNEIRSMLTYALDHSKHYHHGELVFFNEEVCIGGSENLDLISIIHQDAIDNRDGFYLCYQPIVDVQSGDVKGMEALIRWKMEPYGVVPPGVFIEWLEEDVCIYDLGNWVLKTALEDCRKLANDNPNFFVNVNVCPAQLERKEFRQIVLDAVRESGLSSRQLCLELTERCRRLDVEFLKEEVAFFRSNGIKVALDDFGTGTSSLSVVLDLPLDEVKIDMSFVKDIQHKPYNQAMVKSIIDFSDKMDLEICIEGVENKEVQSHLKNYGATWFQGYYYAKPMPISEFKNYMAKK